MDTFKRIVGLLLVFVMLTGMFPATAAHASEAETVEMAEEKEVAEITEADKDIVNCLISVIELYQVDFRIQILAVDRKEYAALTACTYGQEAAVPGRSFPDIRDDPRKVGKIYKVYVEKSVPI